MRIRGSVGRLCAKQGMTRQNYYASARVRRGREIEGELALHLVRRERRQQPRLGARKLHWLLKEELAENGVNLGRDKFFELLREAGLLVPRLPRSARTTDSRHPLPVFRNLTIGLEPAGPNEIWVSDITYVRTDSGFVYVSLIMDRYSRKIVGYHCGESLEASGSVKALEMALGGLPEGWHPVHHSDRGCQYCCHEYVDLLMKRGLAVSMTEQNHCYENAHAERVNGILKQEYGLGGTFRNVEEARKALEEAVRLYNTRRPHMSLGMRFPEEVHRCAV